MLESPNVSVLGRFVDYICIVATVRNKLIISMLARRKLRHTKIPIIGRTFRNKTKIGFFIWKKFCIFVKYNIMAVRRNTNRNITHSRNWLSIK